MRTLTEIKQEIDRLTDRRADVLHQLSDGHNAELAQDPEQGDGGAEMAIGTQCH